MHIARADDVPCADPMPETIQLELVGTEGAKVSFQGRTDTLPLRTTGLAVSSPVVVYGPTETYVGVLPHTASGRVDLAARAAAAIPITVEVASTAEWTLWNGDDLVGKAPMDLRIDPGVVQLRLSGPDGATSLHALYTVEPPRKRGERTRVVLEPTIP